ncbi:MAG: presqualene diphosphate synthase HpnD [Mariprofundales bacterium]|nr:presqualene diphosphate synthase HpnD [Mariprofundales bacterium]
MNPRQYCEQRTRGSGSSFFYAFLFLPEQKRRAMMALYAFCREVDDIADEIRDRDIARSKLAFWQQEIDAVFDSQQQATHPVGLELSWVKSIFPLEQSHFNALILGMLTDVEGKPIANDEALEEYCYRVAGVVGLMTIAIFGYHNPQSRDFAIAWGRALQLTNILRDVAEDAKSGRIYLPQQSRLRFGVADQDLVDGNLTDGVNALLTHYGDLANTTYHHALELLPTEDRASLRASLAMGAIYYAHLQRLRQSHFDVWNHPATLSPLHKIWLTWRMWRREKVHPNRPVRMA